MVKKIFTTIFVLIIVVGIISTLFVSGTISSDHFDGIKEKISELLTNKDPEKKEISLPPEADTEQQKYGEDETENLAKEIDSKELNKNNEEEIDKKQGEDANKPKRKVITYDSLLEKGEMLFKDEEYEKAIDYFEKASKMGKENHEPYLLIAESDIYLNRLKDAEEAINLAQKINPDSPQSNFLLGRIYLAQGKYDEALSLFEKLTDDNQKGTFYRGVIFALKEDYKKSQEMFELSKKIGGDKRYLDFAQEFLDSYEEFNLFEDGKKEHLWGLLARAANSSELYHTAETFCIETLKSIPNFVDVWNQLGYARLGLGKFEEAEDSFKESYRLDPTKVETHYLLAYTKDNLGKVNEALTFYDIALKNGFTPKYIIYERLADLYFSVEKYDDAARFYKKTLSGGEVPIESFVRPVWIYIEHLNEPEEALVLALEAEKKYPNEAMSHNLVGWSKLAMGEYTEARSSLKKAIELDPDFASPYLNLGIIAQKEGSTEEAKEYFLSANQLGKGTSVGDLAAELYSSLKD